MIEAPRKQGDYSLRHRDCQRAIEPPAMMILHGSRAPFFDFLSILHAILPAAIAAGWREQEVKSALEEIVHDHRTLAR